MKWFRRGGQAAVAEEPAAEGPESHPSLALSELFTRRDYRRAAEGEPPRSRRHVLDLGPAVGANISFLADHFPCSVEVVDLMATLRPAVAEGAEPEEAVAAAIAGDGEPADLVLTWDVFNYLTREQFKAAGERLAARCRPGALLFAMIVTGHQMSGGPGTYLLQDSAGGPGQAAVELVYRRGTATRPSPRFRPAEVDAMLPGFSVDRSMLLRHGIQEFLMIRDAPEDG